MHNSLRHPLICPPALSPFLLFFLCSCCCLSRPLLSTSSCQVLLNPVQEDVSELDGVFK